MIQFDAGRPRLRRVEKKSEAIVSKTRHIPVKRKKRDWGPLGLGSRRFPERWTSDIVTGPNTGNEVAYQMPQLQ